MPEPTGCFIDFEPDGRAPNMAEGARVGAVRYRQRPKDSGCLHEQVCFGKPQHREGGAYVDVMCLVEGCGHCWEQVKVTTRTLADEGARR